jgi:hypothetical protein
LCDSDNNLTKKLSKSSIIAVPLIVSILWRFTIEHESSHSIKPQ